MQPAIPDLETRLANLEAEVSRIMARVFPPPPPPPSAEELAEQAAFDALVTAYGDRWPDKKLSLQAWRGLNPAEQAEALARAPDFLRAQKEAGCTYIIPLHLYLRDKRWTYFDVKAQP